MMGTLANKWTAHCKSVLAGILLLVFLAGCQDEPTIETVTLPISKSGLPIAKSTESRMVVAMSNRPEATWFFKITGPAVVVDQLENEWIDILKSVQYNDANKPSWDSPKNWESSTPSEGRFATLRNRSVKGQIVELAISSLGPKQDLVMNLNRWRGQLGLAPIGDSQLEDEVGELEHQGGAFMMFDRKGTLSQGLTPPFAGGGMNATPPTATAPKTTSSGTTNPEPTNPEPTVQYETPAGWVVKKNVPVVAVRLEKSVGDQVLQISVTPMTSTLAPWENSATSWVAESGTSNAPQEIIAATSQKFEISGKPAQRIDLIDLPDAKKAVVGVRVDAGDQAWFIKMAGPNESVKEALQDFASFLDSLKFE